MWLWVWLAGTAIVGIVVGYFIGFRVAVTLMRPAIQEFSYDSASDRNFLLSVLRRELANWMLRHDPDRYLQIYRKAHEIVNAISARENSERRMELAKITEKHKSYKDFDLLETRDYVLYPNALSVNNYDEIESHYIDIIKFQALKVTIDKNWSEIYPKVHTTSDNELAHLEKYVRWFKDTLFENRLKDAIHEFHVYRAANSEGALSYETATFRVRPVSHFAELRYGVHFKDTDEYGLYTIFHGDGDKDYRNFYRSDATFQQETLLDTLTIDIGDA